MSRRCSVDGEDAVGPTWGRNRRVVADRTTTNRVGVRWASAIERTDASTNDRQRLQHRITLPTRLC